MRVSGVYIHPQEWEKGEQNASGRAGKQAAENRVWWRGRWMLNRAGLAHGELPLHSRNHEVPKIKTVLVPEHLLLPAPPVTPELCAAPWGAAITHCCCHSCRWFLFGGWAFLICVF